MNPLMKLLFLITCLMLSACSENPLLKYPPEKSAQLLSRTSKEAMTKLGFKETNMSKRYSQCMEHTTAPSFDCDHLFSAMARELNKNKVKVTKNQIADKELYAQIRDELTLGSYFSL